MILAATVEGRCRPSASDCRTIAIYEYTPY
jgi:hypothetical protein